MNHGDGIDHLRLAVAVEVGRGVGGVELPVVAVPHEVGNLPDLHHDVMAFEFIHLDLVA